MKLINAISFLACLFLLNNSAYSQSGEVPSVTEPAEAPVSKDPARETLFKLLSGEWVSRALYTATKLGIADLLQDGPKSVEDLAVATNAQADSLQCILHLLAGFGVFEETHPRVYANTESSALLAKNNPNGVNSLTIWYGEDVHVSWEELLQSVVTGHSAFQLAFRQPMNNYLKDNPSRNALFHQAMKEKSNAVIQSAIATHNFGQFKSVVDIGGGYDQFIQAILERHPHVKGIVFDLPEVINILKLQQENLPQNIQLSAGDYYEKIPQGSDAYILKSVLAELDDAKSAEILDKCHEAMTDESRLFIVEPVALPNEQSQMADCNDLLSLATDGTKERSLSSIEELLDNSGFTIESVQPTSTEFSVIEARKKAE